MARYPSRFIGFTASLPMNNPEQSLKEMDRAVSQLGARGIQILTNFCGKPLDAPEFLPLFEEAARRDLAIWMHPARGANFQDYLPEDRSQYEIWWTFGWPYETSAAMARMVFSGFFERLRPVDYFRIFYGDTALFGALAGTRCGVEFFGVDHVVFASDVPFEPQPGLYIRETIRCIESLGLTSVEKDRIYRRNALGLLKMDAVAWGA